ncbi:unnamed protein product [Ectocarpus sp. 8 AP-2014]
MATASPYTWGRDGGDSSRESRTRFGRGSRRWRTTAYKTEEGIITTAAAAAAAAAGPKAQQASNDGFGGGYEQQQQSAFPGPPAPGYDPPPEVAQQQGGYPLGGGSAAASTDASFDNRQGQQHPASPPPPFFDPQAPPPVPPQDDGGGGGSSNGYGNEPRSAGGYGDGSIGGDTVVDTFGAATVPEGRHGTAGSSGSGPSFEPQQAGAASVGQGWSTPGVDAVHAREEPAAKGVEEDDVGKAGSTMATVPADPQGGGVSGSASTAAAAAAAAWPGVDNADATAPSERRAGGSEPVLVTETFDSSSVVGVSLRSNGGDGALDTMPSSADHGKEEVDWGTGVEEDGDEEGKGAEGESGETVEVPGSEEKLQLESEEKALIRELERMDSTIGNGDDPPSIGSERPRVIGDGGSGVSTLSPTTPPPLQPPPPSSEHQAMIDREVEHQLDDLFDSIILDDVDDPDAEGGEYPVPSEAAVVGSGGVPGQGWGSLVNDHEEDAVDAVREQAAAEPTQAADQARRTPSSHGDASVHAAADARARGGVSTPGGAPPGAASTAAVAGEEEEGEPPVAAEATAIPEVGSSAGAGSAGSLWGNTRRWETLPPQPDAATSDPVAVLVEEEEVEEEEEEEEEIWRTSRMYGCCWTRSSCRLPRPATRFGTTSTCRTSSTRTGSRAGGGERERERRQRRHRRRRPGGTSCRRTGGAVACRTTAPATGWGGTAAGRRCCQNRCPVLRRTALLVPAAGWRRLAFSTGAANRRSTSTATFTCTCSRVARRTAGLSNSSSSRSSSSSSSSRGSLRRLRSLARGRDTTRRGRRAGRAASEGGSSSRMF